MKKFPLSVLFFSLIISLVACGENFLASNVSLGGSGSGTQKPRPGGSDSTGNGKDDEDNYEYYMTIPDAVTDECLGVQRTMHFIYADSKQPILPGTKQLLTATPLQIELRNSTPNYIFEQVPECRQMEVWSELGNVHVLSDQYLRCAAEQNSIQVLRPYETRIYEFDVKLPNDADQWKMKYTVANYSIQSSTNDLHWTQCQPLEIKLQVDKIFKPKKPLDPSNIIKDVVQVTNENKTPTDAETPIAGKPMQKKE